jgi:hypothetical protein
MGSINTPDFTKGFPVDDLQNDGMIQGKVGNEDDAALACAAELTREGTVDLPLEIKA